MPALPASASRLPYNVRERELGSWPLAGAAHRLGRRGRLSKTRIASVRSSSPPDATLRPFMLPARISERPVSPRTRANPPSSLPDRPLFVRSSSPPWPCPRPGSRFLTSISPFILPVSVSRSASCPFSLPARRHNCSAETPRIPLFSVRSRSPEQSTSTPA